MLAVFLAVRRLLRLGLRLHLTWPAQTTAAAPPTPAHGLGGGLEPAVREELDPGLRRARLRPGACEGRGAGEHDGERAYDGVALAHRPDLFRKP
jgi:hypothetical protein